MGDPNGIGPEVLLKAISLSRESLSFQSLIFGDSDYLLALAGHLGLSIDWNRIQVKPAGNLSFPPPWGSITPSAGEFALKSLQEAARFCLDRAHPLLVTAPVNKKSLTLAGFRHPGQTEFLGELAGVPDKATMVFLSDHFHLLPVTVHTALRNVSAELSRDRIVFKGILFLQALKALGIARPRVAVCGLNPHASEEGMFGDEEDEIIEPAIHSLNRECKGEFFFGPYPSDTVFFRIARGDFDAAVTMYHDQGLIPLKMVAFDKAVNTTLGLPIVRISPDHGTAFDIAGEGKADPTSMLSAIKWGMKLCQVPRNSI
jgi:4-hydroxythreonine-4-phosphate dehydrogenase